MPQPMQNLEDNSDPTPTMNKALALIAKSFKFNTIPTNNNQRSSLIPRNSQIAQPDINTSQDIKMQMVDYNVGNQVRQNDVQNEGNEYRNGNVVTALAEGNGINGNLIRCYNCQEIQSTLEEFKFMTAADAHEEKERVKINCTSEDTLQQASTSRTQSDNAPVYDSDRSTECLVTANHDVCVLNYVNDMNSRADNQSDNVSKRENQKEHKANVRKLKELGSKGSLASYRTSKPITCLRWIPTGRIFAMCGKLTASSNIKNKQRVFEFHFSSW
nr:hypothetical protein [Tanacetum cinerariifolium]